MSLTVVKSEGDNIFEVFINLEKIATYLRLSSTIIYKAVKFIQLLYQKQIETGSDKENKKWLEVDSLIALRLALKQDET